MWELIRANKRKSVFLFAGMFFVLALLGFVLGGAMDPHQGPYAGIVLALFVTSVMGAISFFSGDKIILKMAGAIEITHDMHPQLFNVVEEMKIAANLPVMPKIYIIPDMTPNAFATGKKPENSAIAVTAGLLSKLNRDELQGVIAHEMSHIINRDVLFMTMAGVMLGSIVFVSEIYIRSMFFSRGSRYSGGSRGRGGGQAQFLFLLVAIIMAILAPLMARLFYFAISRKREYLADASAARLTRYPEGLASALEKISLAFTGESKKTSKVLAPMYIVNPLHNKTMNLSSWTSTHPPTHLRVEILRNMMGGASYNDYQSAYNKASGEKSGLIPFSELRKREQVTLRKGTAEKGAHKSAGKTLREAGDIIRTVNKFAFILCACGLKMKIPPQFKKKEIGCPRCGRNNHVPRAELAAVAAALEAVDGKKRMS